MNERFHWLQDYLPWLYAVILSVWGATVHVAQRLKAGDPAPSLIVDGLVCVFAGSLAFFYCQWQVIDGWPSAIVISLSAHGGPRAIGLYQEYVLKRFRV